MCWEPWDRVIDELVSEILNRFALEEPPVDALYIARLLGCQLAYDSSQQGRGRQKQLSGQPAVFLRPDDRPERLQWATGHELGEIVAWQICKRTETDLDELPAEFREQLANRFASRLLLPSDWFQSDLRFMGRDLFLLKERYRTASHELIARRLLDATPSMILSIFDQGQLTCRQNGYRRQPGRLLPREREAVILCRDTGKRVLWHKENLQIEVWPIHEPGWQREILFTLPANEEDSGERESLPVESFQDAPDW